MAQDRQKKLAKLEENILKKDVEYKKVRMNLKPLVEPDKVPLSLNNIDFNYENQSDLYNNLSFVISPRERFLIVGENGVGKSTLLKLIVGLLKPSRGSIYYGKKTEIAYYAQEQENLDLDKTVLENVKDNSLSDKEIRSYLGGFLFTNDDVYKKVAVLSPGEKARVCLCKLMIKRANLLLLDEPTNHLDPETQRIIGESFKNYEGTIIMVSHNPAFVSAVGVSRMLLLPSGKITNFESELLYKYHEAQSKG